MTIEEAIIHAEEVADRCDVTDGDRACAEEYRQLAEWLRELKKLRDHNKNLCDSCTTKDCIFQSGIVRNSCDFYSAKGR